MMNLAIAEDRRFSATELKQVLEDLCGSEVLVTMGPCFIVD